jgi:urease subunit beta
MPIRGEAMKPGEYLLDVAAGPIEANVGRKSSKLVVKNTGDRPIQVGSHFHFFETNASLLFDRSAAYGLRLNIAAGTAVRFEPGEEKEVELTEFGGQRVIRGLNSLVEGSIGDVRMRSEALSLALSRGFASLGGDYGEDKKR